MNKEIDESYACELEMKGGLASEIKYSQKFVKAPLSQHPSKAPSQGKEMPNTEAMKITMGK